MLKKRWVILVNIFVTLRVLKEIWFHFNHDKDQISFEKQSESINEKFKKVNHFLLQFNLTRFNINETRKNVFLGFF